MSGNAWSVRTAAAVVMLAAIVAIGCDDRSARSSRGQGGSQPQASASHAATAGSSDAAAQTASAGQPATHPADAQSAKSFLSIDGKIVEFPSARLRLTKTEEGVRALLYSNDPKEAISANYKGNSFNFDIPLKIADPHDIADAEYYFQSPTSEAEEESPNGIFLNGIRGTQLQPQDVVIKFDGDSPKVTARIAGRFLVVSADANSAPGQFVPVTGTLFMTAEVKDE